MARFSRVIRWMSLALFVCGSLSFDAVRAADKKKGKQVDKKKAAAPNLPPLKTAADKLRFLEKIHQSFPAKSTGADIVFTPETLDRELNARINLPKEQYAAPVDDEGFVRRAYFDLTGKPPTPTAVREFVADQNAKKRAALIDSLLSSSDFNRHWARYWRNVIFYNATARGRRVNPQALEDWFAEQFAKNTGWDRITSELISATPKTKRKKDGQPDFGQDHGPNNFVLAYENDVTEVASQTARIFMGISIQCAECHDHPFDRWKREQFHEFAAFFAPGKYLMPDQYDPSKKTEVKAKFLLGEKPMAGLDADGLRVAAAAYLVYNPDNYWFARAYVNRIWSELVGDGFYAVDSMGPDQECVYPMVVYRLAALFRYRDFDTKWVFRTIMNSQAYQREIRTLQDKREIFTAVRPSRLNSDQVVGAVESVTGSLPGKTKRGLSQTFNYDPSVSQESREGAVQQAMMLMNNPDVQSGIGKSKVKAEALAAKSDVATIHRVYLGVLARQASDVELDRAKQLLKQTASREEAVEDLIWVLMNSTEFVTKR